MPSAKPSDWKTKALPEKKVIISLDRRFSNSEMRQIRKGLIPEQMEDKWFVYCSKSKLYFHRSWTGVCIYVVTFVKDKDGFRMVEAEVNRDPKQYKETSDTRDAKMISFLIDLLLLNQFSEFPCDETSPEKKALMKWSLVGRAMLGEHPGREAEEED